MKNNSVEGVIDTPASSQAAGEKRAPGRADGRETSDVYCFGIPVGVADQNFGCTRLESPGDCRIHFQRHEAAGISHIQARRGRLVPATCLHHRHLHIGRDIDLQLLFLSLHRSCQQQDAQESADSFFALPSGQIRGWESSSKFQIDQSP